jgi:hypothetical protein
MSWLVTAIVTPLISYLGGKLGQGLAWSYRWWAEYAHRKSIYDKSSKQAELVESIAEEIQKLVAEGKPVPKELEKRLIDESSKINIGESFPN